MVVDLHFAYTRWQNRLANRDQVGGTTEACCLCCSDTDGFGLGIAGVIDALRKGPLAEAWRDCWPPVE